LPPKNAFEDQVVWITGASQVSPLSTVTLLQGIHVLSLLLTFHAVLCAAVFLIPMSIVNIPMVLLTRLVYRSLLTCAGVRGGTSTLLCSPWRPPHSLIEKRGTATGEIRIPLLETSNSFTMKQGLFLVFQSFIAWTCPNLAALQ